MGWDKTSRLEKEIAAQISKLNATLPGKPDPVVPLTRVEFANHICSNDDALSGDMQFGQAQQQIAQHNAINRVCLRPDEKMAR